METYKYVRDGRTIIIVKYRFTDTYIFSGKGTSTHKDNPDTYIEDKPKPKVTRKYKQLQLL